MIMPSFNDYVKLYGGYKNFPTYTFETTGGLGNEAKIKAPNESSARKMLRGELNSWVKLGKVKSVDGNVKTLSKTKSSGNKRKPKSGNRGK